MFIEGNWTELEKKKKKKVCFAENELGKMQEEIQKYVNISVFGYEYNSEYSVSHGIQIWGAGSRKIQHTLS